MTAAALLLSRWIFDRLADWRLLAELWKEDDVMFAKPEWFRLKTWGWGITPVTWQGWVYALAFGAVIAGPFIALLSRRQWIEGLVWMAIACVFLTWEVWRVRRSIHTAGRREEIFEILDDEGASHVATRNFDLQLKNREGR